MPIKELCRKHGFSEPSYYAWKAKFGGTKAIRGAESAGPNEQRCDLGFAVDVRRHAASTAHRVELRTDSCAMTPPSDIDTVLVHWGERLFYPGIRIVKGSRTPRLSLRSGTDRAAAIRARIEATVVRRAPRVMVKVTGGGRGMKAIAAHFRYISKNGRLEIEDELGRKTTGRDAVRELVDDWRVAGTRIDDEGFRREACNIMLSMPRGTDPQSVQRAARAFAQEELAEHRYVMVLHDHQAHPHVHLSVRAESRHGKRLNPRKADLQRWREVFADKLRELGIDAEATRQSSRGQSRESVPLWRLKARQDGRERARPPQWSGQGRARLGQEEVARAWRAIGDALARSGRVDDQRLARSVREFAGGASRTPRSLGGEGTRAAGDPRDMAR